VVVVIYFVSVLVAYCFGMYSTVYKLLPASWRDATLCWLLTVNTRTVRCAASSGSSS